MHKDSLKENLYELLNLKTLEDSQMIGFVSIKLMYALAEESLKNGIDLVMEAPFSHLEDVKKIKRWQAKYNLDIYSVVCVINENERKKRYKNRLSTRHKSHHDQERIDRKLPKCSDYFEELPGKRFRAITNVPADKNIDLIISFFNLKLKRRGK